MGLGIIIPVLPKLIAELVNSNLSEASSWGGILMGTYAAMQFLFAPVIGGLSDSFGRRPVLLASLFALGYRDWETDRKSTRLNSSHRL